MTVRSDTRPGAGALPPDPEAEREIDLRRIWDGIRTYWWIVVVGVVGGIVLGMLYSLSGSAVYTASAIIAPGQAFNPGGNQPVQTYLTNLNAINDIATSQTTLTQAAAKIGASPSQLRGKVSVSGVTPLGAETTSPRSTVLIEITARANKRKRAEDAANAVATIVKNRTTSRYVRQSLSAYDVRINNYNARLKTLQDKITSLTEALKQPGLSLNEQLLLNLQLDNAQATMGQTTDSLTTAQQQRILAEDVQLTKVIQKATASKSTARSRRTAVLVGALLGLIVGIVVAIVVDWRAHRPRTA
jgi:uncharacterized protein involved in exopolysaccharide biosynthesis